MSGAPFAPGAIEHYKRRLLPGTPAQRAELRRYMAITAMLMAVCLVVGLLAGALTGRAL